MRKKLGIESVRKIVRNLFISNELAEMDKKFKKKCFSTCQLIRQSRVSLTNEIFDSKHFWMYNQLNSAPRAPTHSINPRERMTSAVAQPKPAVMSLLCPLPGMRDNTNAKPSKSAISMVHRRNSYNRKSMTRSMAHRSQWKSRWTYTEKI